MNLFNRANILSFPKLVLAENGITSAFNVSAISFVDLADAFFDIVSTLVATVITGIL